MGLDNAPHTTGGIKVMTAYIGAAVTIALCVIGVMIWDHFYYKK